jgi:uncharacterized protein (TIGR03437 family)
LSITGAATESVSCTPSALTDQGHGQCRITLRNVQKDTTAEVRLSSSSASLQLPASIRTRPGQSAVEFQIDAVSAAEGIVVAASIGTEVVQTTLTVTPDRTKPMRVPGRQYAKPGSELRFQVAASDPAATLTAATLPIGAEFDTASGEFRWNPAGTQIGSHTIGFAAVDSAGTKAMASVPVEVESGQPVVTRIVNGASHSPQGACSPGAVATIEGRWLTGGPAVTDASGASQELAGTKVWANGTAVAILSASATQVSIVCPDTVPGSELQMVVQTDHGVAGPVQTTVAYATPGIFTVDGTGAGQGLALLPASAGVATIRNRQAIGQPAAEGDRLIVYATGIERLANVSVQIGGVQVTPVSIDAVPNRPGLFQVALIVPDAAREDGDFALSLAGDAPDGTSWRSNIVTLALEAISR